MREKIGIDIHSLSGTRTGVAMYVENLVSALNGVTDDGLIRLYSNKLVDTNSKFALTVVRGRPFWTTLWLSLHFLFHSRPKVMLYPAHGLPIFSPSKNVVTIHDLAFEIFPDYFTPKDLKRLRLITKNSVAKADHIIAISKSAKQDLIKYYNVPEDKVTVIYHGCDRFVFKPDAEKLDSEIAKKYDILKPYIISVGTLQKRKNHISLVKAWEKVRDGGVDIGLVLVGAKGWLDSELQDAITKSKYSEDIYRLGYIEKADLPRLYRKALAFVLPSLYEGFGAPVLEAMGCGTPVITSNNSSLIELFSESALIVDPKNIDDIAGAIKKITNDDKLRAELKEKGLRLAENFDWQKTAKMTLEVLSKYV